MLKILPVFALWVTFAGAAFAETPLAASLPEEGAGSPMWGQYYFSLYGGLSIMGEAKETAYSGSQQTDLQLEDGGIYGGALGIRTEGNWRFELDVHHTKANGDNYVEHFTGGGTQRGPLVGNISTTSIMFNAVKEFGTKRLRPYLGAGAGLTMVDAGLDDQFSGGDQSIGQSNEFGFQFMGGAVYDVCDSVQAFFEYRVISLTDSELDATFRNSQGSLDHGWNQHVIAGIRISF